MAGASVCLVHAARVGGYTGGGGHAGCGIAGVGGVGTQDSMVVMVAPSAQAAGRGIGVCFLSTAVRLAELDNSIVAS
eukprot:2931010-Pyramimonas_sp.AAC.1